MDKQIPRVSVVMSVYNGEKYLREAVDSILNQTFTDFEFIIIDDGSMDQTAEILDSYSDLRIFRMKNEKNMLLSASLNKGIAIAQGEYIARMDADDISLPERFKKQVEYLDSNTKIGVLGTWIQYIDASGNLAQPVQYPTDPDCFRWRLCFENPIAHSSTMIRRNLLEKEIYRSDFELLEDYDLWRRLIKLSNISSLSEILVLLRRHQENISLTYSTRQQQFSLRISCELISNLLQEFVPCEYIAKMLSNIPLSMSDSRVILELLRKIYSVFSKENLSPFARVQINKEYANRLFILSAPYYRILYFQKKLTEACFINSKLLTKILTAFMRRIIRSNYFSQTHS